MKNKTWQVKVGCLLVLGALSGCATDLNKKAVSDFHAIAKATETKPMKIADKSSFNTEPSFKTTQGYFVEKKPIDSINMVSAEQIPSFFNDAVSINIKNQVDLVEFLEKLKVLSVIKENDVTFFVAQDALKESQGDGRVLGDTLATGGGGSGSGGAAKATETSGGATSASNQVTLPKVVYSGTLEGLLNKVTDSLNLSWRWTGSRVEVYKFETKMLTLNALVGKSSTTQKLSTASAGAKDGAGADAASASSGQNTEITFMASLWEEVASSLKTLISSEGVVNMSPNSGLVTVKDIPSKVRLVERQVAEFNRIYSKQVVLNVEVYSVDNSGDEAFGIDWNAVWTSGASALNVLTPTNLAATAVGVNQFTLTHNNPTKRLNGSAMLNILGTVGKAALVTSGTLISLNGQSVPLNVSKETAYLKSVSSTPSTVVGAAPTIAMEPGLVTSGFSMNFTPKVQENNKVSMRYSIDLSTLDGIKPFGTAPTVIELPYRSVRNFQQNVSLKSGQTLVLTGFQQATASEDTTGVVSPSFWGMGGTRASKTLYRTIIIVVTPYVIE